MAQDGNSLADYRYVESLSTVTGQVLLREPPRMLDLLAYVDGTVVEMIPQQGVVGRNSLAVWCRAFSASAVKPGARLSMAVDVAGRSR